MVTSPTGTNDPDGQGEQSVTGLPGVRERLRVRLAVFGWIVTAGMWLVAVSQAIGFSWIPLLWTVQAFTPYVLAPAVPVALVALVRRRWLVGAVHLGLACCLVVLVVPVFRASTPGAASPPASAPRLTVAHGNVFYLTDRPAEVAAAMVATGADVLAMTEYSEPVADALRDRDDVVAAYPYVAADAPGDRNGVALWSRHRIVEQQVVLIGQGRAIDAVLDVDGTRVRVLVVHPLPGTDRASLDAWTGDLAAIRERVDPGAASTPMMPALPTMLVGDFNATRWHPALRELLDDGWRSAHESLGRGWSRSWPSDRAWPPLVRIDHALIGDGLIPTAVRDVALPGSDHLGFVVEVALVP